MSANNRLFTRSTQVTQLAQLTFEESLEYCSALETIVREVGMGIGQFQSGITDTGFFEGHESSTIDVFARELMTRAIDAHMDFEGTIRTELRPFFRQSLAIDKHRHMFLNIDEIDGTTNAKRCLAAALTSSPQSLVSIALSTSDSFADLVASAVYTLDQGTVYSALRVSNGGFLAFRDGFRIDPKNIKDTRGDSRNRIMVIGYSNSHRLKKGELEHVLYQQKLKVYEGCRASAMDIVGIIRNLFDAYVDCRAFWSTPDDRGDEQEAMLQTYDVAGVVPIAVGCGLKVTDAEGNPYTSVRQQGKISLVVSRPNIHQGILDTIAPLVAKWKQEA